MWLPIPTPQEHDRIETPGSRVGSEAVGREAEMNRNGAMTMRMDTVVQGGGRTLNRFLDGGGLYEVAWHSERKEHEEELFDDDTLSSGCFIS